MRILLFTTAFFSTSALAQSTLEEVENETQKIQKSVGESQAALEALAARLATSKIPGHATFDVRVDARDYAIDTIQYFIDGKPIDPAQKVELGAGKHDVVARASVKSNGDDDAYLRTFAFRMQASGSFVVYPEETTAVSVVLEKGPSARQPAALSVESKTP